MAVGIGRLVVAAESRFDDEALGAERLQWLYHFRQQHEQKPAHPIAAGKSIFSPAASVNLCESGHKM
jgi:hypothetical protein